MKKLAIFALVCASVLFFATGCNKEDTPQGSDYGKNIAGVYTGKLLYGVEIIEDAYVVTLSRVTSTVVTMYAPFFGTDRSANFNIEKEGNVYSLISATVYNMTTTITGKQMTINYLTEGGYMYTFSGSRD